MSYSLAMAVFGCFSMLFWQFSQFALFTQVGSLFAVYAFDYIPRRTMETLLKGHLVRSYSVTIHRGNLASFVYLRLNCLASINICFREIHHIEAPLFFYLFIAQRMLCNFDRSAYRQPRGYNVALVRRLIKITSDPINHIISLCNGC